MPSGTPAPADAWLIAVDRGGTFTDCCATDPQGHHYRAKLLSNGRLRAGITALETGNTITLLSHFGQRDGFFRGWNARLFFPGNAHRPVWSAPVEHSTGATLTFIEILPEVIPPDSFMELDTGEPAPVTGARLITGTPPRPPILAPRPAPHPAPPSSPPFHTLAASPHPPPPTPTHPHPPPPTPPLPARHHPGHQRPPGKPRRHRSPFCHRRLSRSPHHRRPAPDRPLRPAPPARPAPASAYCGNPRASG